MGAYRGRGGPGYRTYGGGFGWLLTPVVKKLIIANAAVFVLTFLLQVFSRPLAVSFISLFGLVPQGFLFEFRLWQPLTYLFLHASLMHLLFNMLGLWMFGAPLERDWGGRRFLRYYLLTGVGAGLFSVLVTALVVKLGWMAGRGGEALLVPTIGASGAIYGILLAFGLLYPSTPIYIWFLFPVPARVFVFIFGAIAFLSALQGPGTGVSHVAHLGGMLFGYVYLRGGLRGLWHRARLRYADWRMQQARRKFEVYMRDQDEPERHDARPNQWIN
ncbi:MAG: rhomboid family intramembrane serine protease [Acidobacteria bacterium]|nr:rhomboid family intramembrane serine protease [Acidobacteriota bacterium]